MKLLKCTLCWLLLLLLSCKKHENATIIRNVNFFDGEKYSENVHLAFEDDKIVEVSNEAISIYGAKEIDGRGKTIIPPLLNAHVHAWNKEQLKEAMDAGVFALLDMHNTDETAADLRKYRNWLDYAYYYSSGPGATVPGGHGTEYGFYVPTINDSVSPEKFTLDRIKNGADYIKILREPVMKSINYDQISKVINTSHKNNKMAVAHISNVFDASVLSGMQVDGFVHIWFDTLAMDAQWDIIIKGKAFIVPTLYVTQKVLEEWKDKPWRDEWLKFEEVLGETKKAFDKGITILAGTDPPNAGLNYGTDLFNELKLLSKAGIPNIEVLKAATTNITRCFKLDEFGKVEPGKKASFILVNGNPVKNISDIEKIEAIWRNGKKMR